MGQKEVLDILKRSKRPMTSTEIAKRLRINDRSVKRILKTLRNDCSINLGVNPLSSREKKKRYGLMIPNVNVYYLR